LNELQKAHLQQYDFIHLSHADDDLAKPGVLPSFMFKPGGYGFAQSF
jgi:hypothetical protein